MAIDRRNFLKHSALAGTGLILGNSMAAAEWEQAPFEIPSNFKLTIFATRWGFQGSYDEFCAKAKAAGYDGIEVWFPAQASQQKELMDAIHKHDLAYGFLAAGGSSHYSKHLSEFKASVTAALNAKPQFLNCHSGRDYFKFEENKALIDYTTQKSKESGIPIYHETHRARILFAAHIAKTFINAIPDLRLTLDISHWCNVHSSLLADQEETVSLALSRTDHIHSRVGHFHSPQVTDPRAPEWKAAMDAHLTWWDEVVKQKVDAGQALTMTTEFGPPDYMATVPYTHQPLADQWAINVYMMELWRERYG